MERCRLMPQDNEALIVQATAGLELQDITLVRSQYDRPSMVLEGAQLVQQQKRAVRFVVDGHEREGQPLLRVRVDLGVRLVNKNDPGAVFLIIEADYIVDYRIKSDLQEEALKAFAEFNAVHNVWPFWRQHVFDVVDKGRLPRIEVPFFAGLKL
ncbi:hypothetical protein MA04_01804 [Alcanivorax balearicus MACL04]|uniref:ASCH domain-containing protein n=2 Tax=Alloalcanivorax balearicus TaxID=413232 RepID=A0ABT2QYA8_9GAMM|nr:hypothetical protein [Alloalcanivorax balearicus MACL04]